MDTGREQSQNKEKQRKKKKEKLEILNMYPIVSSFSGSLADYIKQMNYRLVSIMTFQ